MLFFINARHIGRVYNYSIRLMLKKVNNFLSSQKFSFKNRALIANTFMIIFYSRGQNTYAGSDLLNINIFKKSRREIKNV